MPPSPTEQNTFDHRQLASKLDVIHEDIKKVLVEVNGKYDRLKDELNEERLARTKLEGQMALIAKTSSENEGLWKKVIYTGVGAAVLAVLAGLAKVGGAF